MIPDRARDMREIAAARHEIAREMPRRDRVDGVDEAVDHEDPGEEEMPAPAHCEPLRSRQSGPARKAPRREIARLVARQSQDARRIDLVPENGRHADFVPRPIASRAHLQQRLLEARPIAPIERGMGVEDLQPAHEQDRHADEIDPVRRTDDQAMTIDRLATRSPFHRPRSRGRHGVGCHWPSCAKAPPMKGWRGAGRPRWDRPRRSCGYYGSNTLSMTRMTPFF